MKRTNKQIRKVNSPTPQKYARNYSKSKKGKLLSRINAAHAFHEKSLFKPDSKYSPISPDTKSTRNVRIQKNVFNSIQHRAYARKAITPLGYTLSYAKVYPFYMKDGMSLYPTDEQKAYAHAHFAAHAYSLKFSNYIETKHMDSILDTLPPGASTTERMRHIDSAIDFIHILVDHISL